MIKAIFAVNEKGVMGDSNSPNGLPWNCPADMKRFRQLTTGHIVVMGYKTWRLMGYRKLPNRTNVISVGPGSFYLPAEYDFDIMTRDLADTMLDLCTRGDVWIIGGPKTIQDCLPAIYEMHVSVIEDYSDGDCKMPRGLFDDFLLTEVDNSEGVRFYKYVRVAH